MDIPSAFTNSLLPLAIRTKSPDTLPGYGGPPSTPQFSSLDSGYGSGAPSPEKPSTQCDAFDFGSSYTFDGSAPDSLGYLRKSGPDECPRSVLLTPEQKLLQLAASSIKASSVRQPHRARCSLPAAFYAQSIPRSARRHGSDSLSSYLSTCAPVLSIRAPDRFVHPRDSDCAAFPLGEKFRLTKPADDLTATEKILRHGEASADAFSATPTQFNPVPTYADERQAALQREGRPPLTRTRTTLDTAYVDGDVDPTSEHRPVHGSVWSVGTVPPTAGAVDNGQGVLMQTGTSAPFFMSDFVRHPRHSLEDDGKHAGRLAAALDFDCASRILQCNVHEGVFKLQSESALSKTKAKTKKTAWNGAIWVKEGVEKKAPSKTDLTHETRPLRILSAPKFRDDFYCSLLAYCPTTDTVAVGLADLLYTWSEADGAAHLNGGNDRGIWLTSLAFSSAEGGKSILAFGRSNCVFGLMAVSEANNARMLVQEASAISCLSWRPTCTMRPSKNPHNPGDLVSTEDLLVGTDAGIVLYYVVEWPDKYQVDKDKWQGDLTLVSRISIHQQQVCGLAWAPNGASFATGGNDNYCCFFYADDVLPRSYRPGGTGKPSEGQPRGSLYSDVADSRLTVTLSDGSEVRERIKSEQFVRRITPGTESWRWEHGAAVKAIAFCPWQDGLVATGGGSNDRCIHFYHTTSGTALATIFVSSQVTSLMWSTTRREIAVTFGFAHPSHSIRIAVYSWPECKQVATIPWEGKHRALYGISCSRGRSHHVHGGEEEEQANTLKEGCIAVASSDESIKFYKLWPSDNKPITGGVGMLGGSDILEDLEGIQKEGNIIR